MSHARLATSAVFFVHGVLFASWTPHIPAIKTALGLSDASLGVALTTTFGWVGFLCGPPVIGLLASKLTLPVSLGLVAVLCLMMTVLANAIPCRALPTTTSA